jgi:phosphoesterase RecJ-like protein
MKNDPLGTIRRTILARRRWAITSHLRPDGDSICTSLALAFVLKRLGKVAHVVNKDKTPFPFNLFADNKFIRIGQIPARGYDGVLLLECADVARSGQESLDGYFKINIDHHYSNDFYADINWVNPKAAAVGEMAFSLVERLGAGWTPRIANHLYCAIVSDTGSFQFSNTTAEALEVSSRLVRLGADPIKVSERLFSNYAPEKIRLLGRVLASLRMNPKGNIAVITMFRHDLSAFNHNEVDTEDITTLARSIKGVDVVLFFKEMEQPRTFRVSIRSKGQAHAASIAETFGGGGHAHAAGFTAVGDYDRLAQEIPSRVEELLRRGVGPHRRPSA